MNGIGQETGQFFPRNHFFEIVDQEVDLFFSLIEIHLFFEVNQLEQGVHGRIIVKRDLVSMRELNQVTDVSDHFAAAFLEILTTAVQFADFPGEHKAAHPVHEFAKFREDFFVSGLEIKRLDIGLAVFFVEFGILHPVQKHRRAIDNREMLRPRQAAFAEKIVRHVFSGIAIREKRKKLGVKFPARALKVHKPELIFFVEVANDVADVTLGFFINVSILDMDNHRIPFPLEGRLDRSIGIRKIRPVHKRSYGEKMRSWR
ncbi:MAG: hypothetical protein BWY44_01190 [Candidatus Omnitrophica bacterium ADurb.Bin292]|nr:MAG: hypothetical protein BWY44_01190 [Candidatus Omnitrophica bacterium ADurb.Bin292]